jgi:hypothetical protein
MEIQGMHVTDAETVSFLGIVGRWQQAAGTLRDPWDAVR